MKIDDNDGFVDENYEDFEGPQETQYDEPTPEEAPEPDMSAPLTRAEFLEAIKQFQAPAPQQTYQPPSNDTFYDPTYEARKAIRVEEEMMAEVNSMYPDLPADAKADIRNRIGNYRTYEDLLSAKQNKVHELLANAKAGELFRSGKWVPASVKKQIRTEPANTERPRQVSSRIRSEVDQYNSILKEFGVQIDENDLKGRR